MPEVRVSTGSRLHFGLVSLPPRPDWRDDGASYYGGAGLMIAEPSVTVVVERSDSWSASGPLSARTITAGKRCAAALGLSDSFAIRIERCPREHIGLGVGTQLELSIAVAISRIAGRTETVPDIAATMGRGRRSGIGVGGFAEGGFLIDKGKRAPDQLSDVRRHSFPMNWLLLLITPKSVVPWHGDREAAAFASIGAHSSARMKSLLATAIEPELLSRNVRAFGDALTEFNALAGEAFRRVQGGRFASSFVADAIEWLRSRGAAAAGQSSWGPTVFSIWDSTERMTLAHQQSRTTWTDEVESWTTTAAHRGAVIEDV